MYARSRNSLVPAVLDGRYVPRRASAAPRVQTPAPINGAVPRRAAPRRAKPRYVTPRRAAPRQATPA